MSHIQTPHDCGRGGIGGILAPRDRSPGAFVRRDFPECQ